MPAVIGFYCKCLQFLKFITQRSFPPNFCRNGDYTILCQTDFHSFFQNDSIILKMNRYTSQRNEVNIYFLYDCSDARDFCRAEATKKTAKLKNTPGWLSAPVHSAPVHSAPVYSISVMSPMKKMK